MKPIAFIPPFHGIPVTGGLTLHDKSSNINYLTLSDCALEQMPDIIIYNETRYIYSGVSDGRGQYVEIGEN